jgi:hypothetical protein
MNGGVNPIPHKFSEARVGHHSKRSCPYLSGVLQRGGSRNDK